MNPFSSFRSRTKKRLEREAENWRAPRTMAGQNIGLVEAVYYAIVLIVALALSAFAQKSPAVQVLVFGAAVVALSAHVRRGAIPVLYDAIGPKFGWPPFSEAIKEELAANGEKALVASSFEAPQPGPVAKDAPAPVSAAPEAEPAATPLTHPAPQAGARNPNVQGILDAYAALPKGQRRSRSLNVVEYLHAYYQLSFPELDDEEDEQAKRVVADAAIMSLWRKECAA